MAGLPRYSKRYLYRAHHQLSRIHSEGEERRGRRPQQGFPLPQGRSQVHALLNSSSGTGADAREHNPVGGDLPRRHGGYRVRVGVSESSEAQGRMSG